MALAPLINAKLGNVGGDRQTQKISNVGGGSSGGGPPTGNRRIITAGNYRVVNAGDYRIVS